MRNAVLSALKGSSTQYRFFSSPDKDKEDKAMLESDPLLQPHSDI